MTIRGLGEKSYEKKKKMSSASDGGGGRRKTAKIEHVTLSLGQP